MIDLSIVREARIPADLSFDLARWWRCNLKVLVVTDSSSGGYSKTEGFHLGLALDVIENDGWPHVAFQFTKAHRTQPGSGPVDLTDFRFNDHDLNQYSQIWLFGISRDTNPLLPAELEALSRFMNERQGGVFATGDHEDLGKAISGEVPRVRSMRRWAYPAARAGGRPVAPPRDGNDRHNTIASGTESDSTPQMITPRFYTRTSNQGFLRYTAHYPHPVLCGPTGPINYLPDHMHEGECEVPGDLTGSYNFDGYSGDEYPTVNGARVSPEVIATAQSNGTNDSSFGVLSTYDGHAAGVGRVLCDATWHHWFNTNLRGSIENYDNAGSPGYSAADAEAWLEIKAYFRNIGPWLATPHHQRCLRNGGFLLVSRYNDFVITYRNLDTVDNRLGYFFGMGTVARDALGRLASQCQTTQVAVEALEEIELLPDPWKGLGPDDPYGIDRDVLERVALGGAIHFVAEQFAEENFEALMEEALDKVEAIAKRGARAGTLSYMEHLQRTGDTAASLAKRQVDQIN